MANENQFHFFLGGQDLEMQEIRGLLEAKGQPFDDARPGWGAGTALYADRMAQVAAEGKIPVAIELTPDAPVPPQTVMVDHHGARAHEPASIIQVAQLIGADLTRDQRLVAANDAGYINAMRREGASTEEILAIRARDRAAQGITPEQEAQAERAIERADANGGIASPDGLKVVRCPHARTAAVVDRYRARPDGGPKGILVLSDDGEVNYSGPGHIAKQLAGYFPEHSWSGGEGLGKKDGEAFFGTNAGPSQALAVYAATVALTAMDARVDDPKKAHRQHADFLGYTPWVDRKNPLHTTPFEGGFYAVDLAHASKSRVPIDIWAANGGSFTSFLRTDEAALKKAERRLDPNHPDAATRYDKEMRRHQYSAVEYAVRMGASREIKDAVRGAVIRERAAILNTPLGKAAEAATKAKRTRGDDSR